ncbi:aminopeptidase P N-terminal domain-containing protein [Polluticaenibacter yanchengensis]|uniref:Xaa-Pro aminopeptidase n=1 Tax=Polluticaenibacter yanchengensis TaxID=3014562 RepID=A0ABT4UMU5_9BACT|nr:aminopeptidase P N-terminal domain-containing protein [Chitinophagaceae bacterium LY-5]
MKHEQLDQRIFITNRQRFTAKMLPNSLAIFNSNDEVPTGADAIYTFSQNTDLYWLTGIEQEDTQLILNPSHPDERFREVLVLVRPNPIMEKWIGYRLTKEKATAISGIKTIIWLDSIDSRLIAWIHGTEHIYLNTIEHDRKPNHLPTRDYRYIAELKEKYPLHHYLRSQPILKHLRSIKQPKEIAVMQIAVDITNKAFKRVMQFVKPGVFEFEIQAEINHEFLINRAKGEAYNSIIASGDNARILHYVDNDQACKDGDLILMDFGANYAGYAADLSRTIPVNGKFTDRQKKLYNIVLHMLNHAKKLLKPGITINEYHDLMGDEFTRIYLENGLLTQAEVDNEDKTENATRAYRKYTYHGISHFLGINVHDYGFFDEPIKPGMVFTIEPGFYSEAENIGIRIENNIVITEDGNDDLFKDVPITVEEIEAYMAK